MKPIKLRIVAAVLGIFFSSLSARVLALPLPGAAVPAHADAAPPAPMPVQAGPSLRIFDDAMTLKSVLDPRTCKPEAVAPFLKAYGVDLANIGGAPFLNQVTALRDCLGRKAGATAGPAVLVVPQALPMTDLFGAPAVAEALGSLIAERFKQEAEMEAIRNLSARMQTLDRDPQVLGALSAGLPKAMTYLKTVQNRRIDTNDWAVLQSSFRMDVAAFPDNLPRFLDALYGLSPHVDARYLTWLASSTAGQIIKDGRNPYQVIDAMLAASNAFKDAHPAQPLIVNIDVSLRVTAILSHMLTKDGKSSWHSVDELQPLLADSDGTYLLLGLSYARDFSLYTEVNTWLRSNHWGACASGAPIDDPCRHDQIIALMTNTKELLQSWESIHQDVGALPNPLTNIADAGPLVGDLGRLATTSSYAIQAFLEGQAIPVDPAVCPLGDEFCQRRQQVMAASDQAQRVVDIIGDIKSKEYAAALGELIALIDACQSVNGMDPSGKIRDFLHDSGPFIAAIAAAKTSADLTAALETYALPAGSYTQQQQDKFSITLNSFFGAALGAETLSGNISGTGAARTRAHFGIAAPVGVDFNWGTIPNKSQTPGTNFFETGAWSLFLPILDVGAVASWRLGSGGGSVSAITWQNIVAPGIYVVWSKRDSPLSILVGAQYGPELRKVSTVGDNTIERAAIQFPSVEVTFNIPIFNLYR